MNQESPPPAQTETPLPYGTGFEANQPQSPSQENRAVDEEQLEKTLEALVLEVQKYPLAEMRRNGSPQEKEASVRQRRARDKALTRFLNLIKQFGLLNCRNTYALAPGTYQEVLKETRNQISLELCDWLYEYKPNPEFENSLIRLIKWRFRKRFEDLAEKARKIRKVQKNGKKTKVYDSSLDSFSTNSDSESESNLVDKYWFNEWSSRRGDVLEELIQYIVDEDPQGLFQNRCVEGIPEANFKALVLRIVVRRQSWKEIAEEFKCKVPTLSSFYQRSLTKFAPEIRKNIEA